jgi:anti-sigma regulatory factor (Ser/Thr protein kinase)
MGPGGTILELGASVAAARHLAARHRAGGVAILPHDGQETPFSVLLPPTMVTCSEDVSGCIARLLAARGQVPERLLFAACTLLAEAAQNVCEHSGSVGCVAAHWSAGSGAGELGIGIADRGIGIPRSLMPRFRERDLAAPGPERAIVAALRLDDWSGRSRGAGLCMSRRLLGRHGGVLHVRSGGAVVSVGPGDLVLASRSPGRLAAVCGTQIAIYLGGGDGCSVVDTECNSA